LIDVENNML